MNGTLRALAAPAALASVMATGACARSEPPPPPPTTTAPATTIPTPTPEATPLVASAPPETEATPNPFGTVSPPASATPAPAELAERSPLRLQVLLDRAHFSPGEIDGTLGGNTSRALDAFRRAGGGRAGGPPTDEDWRALESAGTPTLVDYTLTDKDVKGPYQKRMPSPTLLPSRPWARGST